jgi:hypothetical protein
MEQTECSETLAYKIQTPGNYQEGNIKHSEQGESLKSRRLKKKKLFNISSALYILRQTVQTKHQYL